ncbi:DUF4352 domain-containing protein [Streptomyces sp. MUM 178J]|uniref:DUF4352 domain-containing protein n=1 Tax=Streptomyces sp. MUM 178J TaxID=2791991 RepID=UPI001F044988|nr:DUF4352 domain-containing protein [Streptomyces sp. MUM 178J]WRQ79788.1 DUF4352 domain-containing protein [Streptomyces sp. MUM 178J]
MSQHSMQQPQAHGGRSAAPTPRQTRNGLGTAALILGIIGTLSGLIPLFFWLAGILGLIALILGLAGHGRVKRGEASNKGVTVTGAILGLAALILSVVGAVITFKAVDEAVTEIDKAVSGNTATKEPAAGGNDASTGEKSSDGKGSSGSTALKGGDAAAYNGVRITVSAPKPYTPAEFTEVAEGKKAYEVTVAVENTGTKEFEAVLLTASAVAGEDGVAAEKIFDGEVGSGFTSAVLPGKKATVRHAFEAPADAKTLTVQIRPGFDFKASQWELSL